MGVAPMQDDLIFIFNVGVGLVPTLSAFRGQPQGIAPTISSQSHATPNNQVNQLNYIQLCGKKSYQIYYPLL